MAARVDGELKIARRIADPIEAADLAVQKSRRKKDFDNLIRQISSRSQKLLFVSLILGP
jgi:hypothetical protein